MAATASEAVDLAAEAAAAGKALDAAIAERGRCAREERDADARLRTLRLPLMTAAIDAPTFDVDDRLRALEETPTAERDLLRKQRAHRDAQAREEGAGVELKRARAAIADAELKEKILPALVKHLRAARLLADQLGELLPQSSAGGDSLGVPWLMSSTPTFESPLDHWLDTVKRYGLL